MDKWKNLLGLLDVGVHSNSGFLGWYWRTATNVVFELRDEQNSANILDSEVLNENYDDILFAMLGGCSTGSTPDDPSRKAMTEAMADEGVDIVLGFRDSQTHTVRELFCRYFFHYCYVEEHSAEYKIGEEIYISVEWGQDPGKDDDYPRVDQAYEAAVIELIDKVGFDKAKYLYERIEVDGTETLPKSIKIYPPRYRKKD